MLIATKVTQKKKLAVHSAIILTMVVGTIYLTYSYYVKTFDLTEPDLGLPAYYGSRSSAIVDINKDKVDGEDVMSKIQRYFDIELFYDPKFRSLRENSAEVIDINLGKKDPFKSFEIK
ncbi:hypothetical protein ISS03_00110 [Patescibacteria group bacterium]|nr:hypothetical protein [Patescibacteria group bacterium]